MIPFARPHPQARFLAPEVVQTSMMDCGPASLQSLVAGFGLEVSYGRLREACQTGVDGTSISTMDEIARFLGLDTEEMIVPADHLAMPSANALPAIVVLRNPAGANHFVVIWSTTGAWLQVMDPAEGRHWVRRAVLFERLYLHSARVPASAWREWTAQPEFLDTLAARLAALGVRRADRARLCDAAVADPGWRAMAALDAATRMVAALVDGGAVARGADCLALIEQQVSPTPEHDYPLILPEYRSAWQAAVQDEDEEMLIVRGAVLVRARGRRGSSEPELDPPEGAARLPPELADAMTEAPPHPARALVEMVVADGLATPAILATAVLVSAALLTVDAILLRGLLDIGDQLGLASQRALAVAGVIGLLTLGLLFEIPLVATALRLGRALDARLRTAFLTKLPRLEDRYFRSRLLSDMAERGHSLHVVRTLPQLGVRLGTATARLVLTVVGITWLEPACAPAAVITAVVCIGVPMACLPLLSERELRVRSHAGALSRFYLDALLGLLPIRIHGAGGAMQRQQDGLLVQWHHAGLRFHRATTLVEGAVAWSGLGMAAVMVWSAADQSTGGLLLLVYWALSLPSLGHEIAIVARQYPILRNVVARLLEPLGTPEPHDSAGIATAPRRAPRAAAIRMTEVTVEAAGNPVLTAVDLEIAAGEHVAIVGASGAGKSSLVGLLLGWYRPAAGTVEVDGRPLIGAALAELRQDTAWVDSAVTLWNRSFLDNLRYGAAREVDLPLAEVLANARLRDVLERLPDGLATELGEGGGMVSGGEGQRTRLGRAMARKQARLVVLDEPFRGLDLATRRELIDMVRRWWPDATLLWVTHDVAETNRFGRVVVLDGGRIVEDGDPAELGARPGSRYAALVRGDREMHELEWGGAGWRRVWVDGGRIREGDPP